MDMSVADESLLVNIWLRLAGAVVPARTDDLPGLRTAPGPDETIMQSQDRSDIGGGFHRQFIYAL